MKTVVAVSGISKILRSLLLISLGFAAAASADDAVERYFDLFPVHAQLRCAESTEMIAWMERRAGRQSLWVARGSERKALYRYDDDGQPLSAVALSADGRWLSYVRGTSPNAQGEVGNPLDLPDPQERVLWILSTGGNAQPRRVAGGESAAISGGVFSPDSRHLVWTAGSEAWGLDVTDARAQPRRLFTIRGKVAQLAWSPDSRRLAFVSLRGTHSFVGLFDVSSRSLRYLAPGLDRDQLPAWSPSGRYLAFVREPDDVQTYRFTSQLEGIPWSIMLADLRSDEVRTLWTANPGLGSRVGVSGDDDEMGEPLLWTHDEQLVFSWEKTGWAQLYRIDLTGGVPTQLTHGGGEVWSPAMSSDRRSLYYHANVHQPERFELFRVSVTGGRAQQLSAGYGATHNQAPVPLRDGRVAFMGFNSRTPAQILVGDANAGPVALVPDFIPPAFPSDRLAEPAVVELQAQDGFKFRALLYKPAGMRKGEHRPAVVYAHGGSRAILTEEPRHGWGLVEALVMSGYVVLAPNYRSGVGYGLRFREAQGYGGGGGTDVLDIIAAGQYLAQLPGVDDSRIGVFGISYGGYLTTSVLARAPHLWAAGASLVGVADWQMELELDRGGARLPFRLSQRMKYEELAHQSSANAHLDEWRAPILFLSGDDDPFGWLPQAIQLGQSLRQRGVEVEVLVEPGGAHWASTHPQLRVQIQRVIGFFDRRLRGLPEGARQLWR